MKKLLSIAVALAVALSMLVVVPAAAVSWVVVVDVDEPLAGEEAEYAILFHNNEMLEGEVDFIDVVFPEGSDVATVVDDPVVLVGPADDELVPIDVASWAAVGTRTLRIYPEEDIYKCMLVMIIIDGVTNPGASHYMLQVGTSNHTPVSSEWYTIYALVRIELEEGKNLISLPYYPEDEAIEVVLKDLFNQVAADPDFEFSVWYWDAVAREWLVYYSDMSSAQIDKIEPAKSYWIKVSEDIDFCFKGVPYPACNGPPVKWYYPAGWNMVGFASQTPMAAEAYLRSAMQPWPKPDHLAVLHIFGWGATGWENIAQTDDLTPGRGYLMAFLTEAWVIPPLPGSTPTAHAEGTSSDTNACALAADHDMTLPTSLAAEPQEIHDWYGLNATRDNLGGSYVLLNDIDSTTPGYEELASSTSDEGKGWQPIGTADDGFTGVFHGQGYKIGDLFIDRPKEDFVGLFGVVAAEAVIQNVGVVDVDVTGDFVVGGLAGWSWGTLSSSYATGTVAGTGLWGAGGLAGVLVGSNAGIIGDSYATGNVTGSSDVGGLAGSNVGTISSSYSTGIVTGEEAVGGLVGSNAVSGSVGNSYAAGSVTGNRTVGGLAGWNYCATMSQSYSTGTVTGNASVGGLVGANTELFSQWGTVSDSFWDTETSGQSSTAGDATGKTTAEMMDIDTFTNTATEGLDNSWDMIDVPFDTTDSDYTWNIVDLQTYPYLSWEQPAALAQIEGQTKGVNCTILAGVAVTLYLDDDEIGIAVSDEDGYYTLVVPGPGEYTVVASKEGFKDKEQSTSVDELTTYAVDFVGDHGLVPNAPNMSYVLACINRWQFGEPQCKLTMSTVLAVINAWQFPVEEQAVTFLDANLEAAIREAIGKPTGDIYPSDLEGLTYLDLDGDICRERITDLTGLEYCINLTHLYLRHNHISDVSPLDSLISLTHLNLDWNQISDISPLAGLTNLITLSLGVNQISDISPLADLTNLITLSLGANQISDVSPVEGLTNLERLYLSGNQISDISPVEGLTNLEWLYLSGNQISDISPVEGLTNLMYLYLMRNEISDIPPLEGLNSLTILKLDDNQIGDISPVEGLTNLERLYLSDNQISDIPPLEGLNSLTILKLDDNQIGDISALAGLTSLITLSIGANQISDVSALAGLTNLTMLYLWRNQITDISPLEGLNSLTILVLVDNQISDALPLVRNEGLGMGDIVDLRVNPLSEESIDEHIPELQGRGVTVYH